MCSLDDLILAHDFTCHLYAGDFQIYVYSMNLLLNSPSSISHCLLDSSPWVCLMGISNNMSQSSLLTFPTKPAPPAAFSVTVKRQLQPHSHSGQELVSHCLPSPIPCIWSVRESYWFYCQDISILWPCLPAPPAVTLVLGSCHVTVAARFQPSQREPFTSKSDDAAPLCSTLKRLLISFTVKAQVASWFLPLPSITHSSTLPSYSSFPCSYMPSYTGLLADFRTCLLGTWPLLFFLPCISSPWPHSLGSCCRPFLTIPFNIHNIGLPWLPSG